MDKVFSITLMGPSMMVKVCYPIFFFTYVGSFKVNVCITLSVCVSYFGLGSWVEDQRQGHGIYTYPNGDSYDGEWLQHQRSIINI